MWRKAFIVGLLFSAFIFPQPVFAHAFGQKYNLPIPTWIFLYGGSAAVLLSFILIGYFVGVKETTKVSEKPIPSSINKILTSNISKNFVRSLGLFLFLMIIISGFVGVQDSNLNINPTLFWVVFLLGFTYFTAIFGNLWLLLSPFRTLADLSINFLGWKGGLFSYPKKLAYWPALLLYLILIWQELFSGGVAANPEHIAYFSLGYTFITILGVILFGRESWFKFGEFFEVFFGLVSKISIFAVEKRKIVYRAPFTGLLEDTAQHFSLVVFIVFMLSSTGFDGFRGTVVWQKIDLATYSTLQKFGTLGFCLFDSLALLLALGIFLSAYLIFLWLMKMITKHRTSLSTLAKAFVLSLVPIAVVYNVAHYYTLLLTQGQQTIALISDPLNLGWNLFGTTSFTPSISFLRADVVWYIQVFFIVLGHIAAVYLAHKVALKLYPAHKQAVISQLPMLALMVAYTLTGLWILSQPFSGPR